MIDPQTNQNTNPKSMSAADATPLDPATQQMLNQPLKDPTGLDEKNAAFLAMLMEKIDRKEIDLFRPSTLLNMPVYEKLSEEAQGKADFDAVNLLATIREIHKLWLSGDSDSYQIQNLVDRIRVTKERLEQVGGDIFVI
jgi:hypothetical protein